LARVPTPNKDNTNDNIMCGKYNTVYTLLEPVQQTRGLHTPIYATRMVKFNHILFAQMCKKGKTQDKQTYEVFSFIQ